MEDKLEFEKYPELTEVIQWFASNVPVDTWMWSKLLAEINKALALHPSESAGVESLSSKALQEEIWSMLSDDARAAMEPLKKSYLESVMADIDSYCAGVKGAVWVKASDRLPEERIRVLVSYDNSIVLEAYIDHDGQWKFSDDEWNVHPASLITHWKPLPDLPSESPTAAGSGKETVQPNKEDAVAFAEWCAVKGWVIRNDKKTWLWAAINIPKEQWEIKTTSQLYDIYKSSK